MIHRWGKNAVGIFQVYIEFVCLHVTEKMAQRPFRFIKAGHGTMEFTRAVLHTRLSGLSGLPFDSKRYMSDVIQNQS